MSNFDKDTLGGISCHPEVISDLEKHLAEVNPTTYLDSENQDPRLIGALGAKLEEYKERMVGVVDDGQISFDDIKADILDTLLGKGKVNKREVTEKMIDKYGEDDLLHSKVEEAYRIMRSYLLFYGEGNGDGQGLPTIDKYYLERSRSISLATDFDGLFKEIEKIGAVKGGSKVYDVKELMDLINGVKDGRVHTSYITRSFGLRQKVIRLLGLDGISFLKDEKPVVMEYLWDTSVKNREILNKESKVFSTHDYQARYEIYILDKLLEDGNVNSGDLFNYVKSKDFEYAEHSSYSPVCFENALRKIKSNMNDLREAK